MGNTSIPYLTHVCNAAVGCSQQCPACWARRFAKRSSCPLCKTFAVHMHYDRLKVLERKKSAIIGISFGGELFDPHRPIDSIMSVLGFCRRANQHTLVFLTRQPQRATQCADQFIGRPDWWLGLTATTGQELAEKAPQLLAIPAAHHWLSLEPLGEPGMEYAFWNFWRNWYDDGVRGRFGWIVIGCASSTKLPAGLLGELGWYRVCRSILNVAKTYRVPVYVKQVPVNGKCNRNPLDWPASLRVQQVPSDWARILKEHA